MASYDHIYNLHVGDANLHNRTVVAIVKHAQYLKALETPTQAQTDWANAALADPNGKADNVFWEVVVNATIADAADTAGVTDGALQTIVDAVCERY